MVSHRHVGGSTDAVWSLVLWLPPGWVPLPLVPVPVQPWVPVLARVNRRNRAVPSPCPSSSADPVPRVVKHLSMHDVVLSTGLFPHNLFSRRVLVEDKWSPTGYGIRPLTAAELADLWDVPLLFQELAAKVDGGSRRIKDLLQSPPAKILALGGDSLLANYFLPERRGHPYASRRLQTTAHGKSRRLRNSFKEART